MRCWFWISTFAVLVSALACADDPTTATAPGTPTPASVPEAPTLRTDQLARLPEPVANNAVAVARHAGRTFLFSGLGLGPGKTWKDTRSAAFLLDVESGDWSALPDVPGKEGRLAGTAAAVGSTIYVFGGYTVAEDGSEKSIETVHALDLDARTYQLVAPMPVPVDDAVCLVYAERYIYLVSGWHDTGNVNLVQVYDTQTDSWKQATPYPGSPVFGHAGGIVNDQMVICDGVKIVTKTEGRREFASSNECYIGQIGADDPARIDWNVLPAHPGPPLYRMAATGTSSASNARRHDMVLFAGGSDNPYNYNGVGYNGEPSSPSPLVFGFDLDRREWITLGQLPEATMDHRGLLEVDDSFVIVGGMRGSQHVTNQVLRFSLTQQD